MFTAWTWYYPKYIPAVTPDDKEKAAKFYSLIPEDYETRSPTRDFNFGDYPILQEVNLGIKDHLNEWDFGPHKRNWGEPVGHVAQDQ